MHGLLSEHGFLSVRRKAAAAVAAASAVVIVLAGCSGAGGLSGGAQPAGKSLAHGMTVRPVGQAITVHVSPHTMLTARVKGVGRISGPRGAFTSDGTITIHPARASFPAASGLSAAGAGVDVTFHGTALRKSLTLSFDAPARPGPDAVPVLVHRADDGTWSIRPIRHYSAGRLIAATRSFSFNFPGWANPLHWWHGLTQMISSGVGGRTSPLSCSGPPAWFHLNGSHSDLVHACAKTNHTSNGTTVAEVQIKSNRGVSLEVTIPGNPVYVWVQGEPWPWRQWVAHGLHFDPNRTVILPAGATMTVGYQRAYTSAPFSFYVTGTTWKAAADTLLRDLIDLAVGKLTGKNGLVFYGYSEIKCATGLSAGGSGADIGIASIRQFLGCWISQVAEELSDSRTALSIASQVSGVNTSVSSLVARAKAVKALKWLLILWPAFQLGIGNDIDAIRGLLTGGTSDLVTYHMDPPPTPSRSKSGATSTGANGSGSSSSSSGGSSSSSSGSGSAPPPSTATPRVTLARGPAAPAGYRYAVRLSGFPADSQVAVTCYDSVSPQGFYTFRLTTDSSGNAATQNECYSGDGPDHWVVAGTYASNHVQWGAAPPPPPSTRQETPGGPTHTWSNPANAGGTAGPVIPTGQTVAVTCRLTGFKVADGNPWWYRIASPGWGNHYYASADAFYNDGATSGSLRGTPWYDPAVPLC